MHGSLDVCVCLCEMCVFENVCVWGVGSGEWGGGAVTWSRAILEIRIREREREKNRKRQRDSVMD